MSAADDLSEARAIFRVLFADEADDLSYERMIEVTDVTLKGCISPEDKVLDVPGFEFEMLTALRAKLVERTEQAVEPVR